MSNELYMASDNILQIEGLQDATTEAYINNADSVKASIFKVTPLHPAALAAITVHKLPFTSGGVYEVLAGDVIEGEISGATATVDQVDKTGGTWGGGDAAGDLYISVQAGTFQAETLKVGVELNVADVAVDSTKNQKTKIKIVTHGLTTADHIRLLSTYYHDNEYAVDGVPDTNHILLDKNYVAETFTGDEFCYVCLRNAYQITLDYVAASDGDYAGNIPESTVVFFEKSWYLIFVVVIKDANQLTIKVQWRAVFHVGT